jgi:hypothetical protein
MDKTETKPVALSDVREQLRALGFTVAAASAIYLVLLFIELFWWPKRRDRLLANADRAAEIAQHFSERQ